MQENKSFTAFQDLRIFENEKINALCDALTEKVRAETGVELIVGGSLAKIFAGQLPEDYKPKDVDFVLERNAFDYISKHWENFPDVVMIEKQPFRMIFYAQNYLVIEIWRNKTGESRDKIYYKHLIPYLLYGKEN